MVMEMVIHWMCWVGGWIRFDVCLLHTNRHADTRSEAFQLVAHQMLQRMVRPRSRSVLYLGTITNGNALIPSVYVKVTHCQCAQMFLSMFHSGCLSLSVQSK